MSSMDLGNRLRELREAAGLSQAQLARHTGVSRNAVSQWESGQTHPSTNRLALLAGALKVPIDELMAPRARTRDVILEVATRLFDRIGYWETSIDVICASADLTRAQFDAAFESKEGLLLEVASTLSRRMIDDLRRLPPTYGTLATRLKYLLRNRYAHDLAHLNITRALLSCSWRWDEAQERERSRLELEFQEIIVGLLDEATSQGQIDAGNHRAASALILAAYTAGLRKAAIERLAPELVIAFLEPQFAIFLAGLNFRVIPGFAETDEKAGA
jgi:transcriptional regulator with XRE-family HTH domain